MSDHNNNEPQLPFVAPGSRQVAVASDHRIGESRSGTAAPAATWRVLRIAAEIYADFQQFRIAASNRAERAGLDPGEFADLIGGLENQEHAIALKLRRAYREAVPGSIRSWQAATMGLGEHSFARLLGLLGDPRMAFPWHWEGEGKERHLIQDAAYPRTISQLWSYCGVGDPNRRRRKGMSAEEGAACGSPRLRSLMFVIAEGCVKQMRSPYRRVYDHGRMEYATRKDEEGNDWSLAHQHAAAMRLVAKEILRDLWLAAREDEARDASEPIADTPLLSAASS